MFLLRRRLLGMYSSLNSATLAVKSTTAREFCMQFKEHKIEVHPIVQNAIDAQKPVVALESTIITHGMPYPDNINTALSVERIIRSYGATPATIGIIDGCIKVGLTNFELQVLAQRPPDQRIKCSRRDLPYVVALKKSAGTTVAATMIIAHKVGIDIFATGGIGGVHRDGHISMDISADLIELGRTPVAVICSGVKSILDIPRTLEYLETQGVCVATYDSPGGAFPAFFTRDSGNKVPYNLKDADSAAEVIRQWRSMKLNSGILIGVPIPADFAADETRIQTAIKKAQSEARAADVTGKDVTPYWLSALARLTDGQSLRANIELIKNNAAVAAQIAQALTGRRSYNDEKSFKLGRKPLVIGASILDLSFTVKDREGKMELNGATYNAAAKQTAGGVGRNIAEALLKLYGDVQLISAVGNDQLGQCLVQMMPPKLQSNLIVDNENSTSLCSLVFDKIGECKLILGNMDIHSSISSEQINKRSDLFKDASLIVMDGNLTPDAMATTLQQAKLNNLPVFFEPTDMLIAAKPFQLSPELTDYIRVVTPNKHELKTIVQELTKKPIKWQWTENMNLSQILEKTKELVKQIDHKFNCIIVTLGEYGVFISLRGDAVEVPSKLFDVNSNSPMPAHVTRYYAAPTVVDVVNVSGAGDSFLAGFITALLHSRSLNGCVTMGLLAAEQALLSEAAVPQQYFQDEATLEHKYKKILETLKTKAMQFN